MTRREVLRPWRALIAISLGTAGLAHADTCAPADLSCTSQTIGASAAPTVPGDPVGDTVDQVQDHASDAGKTVEDTVTGAKDTVGGIVDDMLGSGDPDPGDPGGDDPGGGHGPGPGHHGGPNGGGHDRGPTTGRDPGAARGSVPSTTGTTPGSDGPLIGRPIDSGSGGGPTLAQTVTGIAVGVIAPLLVLLLCTFGFVAFQQRLDGRDPHLADAPAVPDVAVFA
jgi:hypothetical protein